MSDAPRPTWALRALLLAALLPAFVRHLAAQDQKAPARPNLVLILSDDQGFGDYGFMGHSVIQTPNLDRLAGESLVYTRGYVTTALCCPSLATILTGRYPHEHGYTGNDPVAGRERSQWVEHFRRQPQLPALLAGAGYRSMQTGKYWQGDPGISGFTDSMGETGRHGGQALAIGRETMAPVKEFLADAQSKRQPFLLWYAPFLPHTPHTPPERLLAKYEHKTKDRAQAKYFAMCEWLDETCGELLGYLDELGLRDDTIVLFLADNGWSQGERGFRGSKQTLWEHGVRQPFLIRWPGKVAPRRDEQHLVSNLDLAPTMLKAAGLPVPDGMRGVDLLDADAVAARDAIFLEDFSHDMVAPDDPGATLEGRAVIQGAWKLIVTRGEKQARMDPQTGGVFLFDLEHDPKEANDLAAEQPERVAELRRVLDAWWDPKPAAPPRSTPPAKGQPKPDRIVPYRKVGDRALTLHVFEPEGFRTSDRRPAYVVIHGGGWRNGNPERFYRYAQSLVPQGYVGISVQYRLVGGAANQGNTVFDCVADGRAAVRYVRRHAEELGIDPQRIAVGGGSAGGHVALGAALFDDVEHADEDVSVSCRPDALVLLFAVLDTSPEGYGNERIGDDWRRISPRHRIRAGMPPTIVFHGDRDDVAPKPILDAFCERMRECGNRCELVLAEGGKHGHLNNDAELFRDAAERTHRFLERTWAAGRSK